MATSPIFTKKDVNRIESQGVVPVEGGSFTYDPNKDTALPTSEGLRAITAELDAYLQLIDSAAADLVQKGRADQAQNIRMLGDRLKRTASGRGVSAEQIARQIADTTTQLNTQQGLFESKVMADKLSRISGAISAKTGIQQSAFSQDIARAGFRENVLKAMEQEAPTSPFSTANRSGTVKPKVARPSFTSMDTSGMAQRGQEFQDTMNIAKQLDQRDYGNEKHNPLFQGSGSATNTAQGRFAVTQRRMGQKPGLFGSGVRSAGPVAFKTAAATPQTYSPIRANPYV